MGCASSKPKVCQNCQEPYSPVRRSYSMYPSRRASETEHEHLVALTSSTLGSLKLDPYQIHRIEEGSEAPVKLSKDEFAMGLIEAKTWSQMINKKIPKMVPKTPIMTPPGEPETINTWELMEGLEDISPLKHPYHSRSFSFPAVPGHASPTFDQTPSVDPTSAEVEPNINSPPKPLWLELAENDSNSNDTSIVSEFDPEVISAFRQSLEELPPTNPFHLKPLAIEKDSVLVEKDRELEPKDAKRTENEEIIQHPCIKEKLVLYFTSLRGVRKTYEDCCYVRMILKSLGVKIDERDVSMHSGFKEELKELLGEDGFRRGGLPRVFVGKKCLGGAEEIRKMHEDGRLEKAMEGCERVDDGGGKGGGGNGVCDACGDIRFIPCETCSGSCKIYYDADYDDEESPEEEIGFQRCPDCNENGLIRCPICCD